MISRVDSFAIREEDCKCRMGCKKDCNCQIIDICQSSIEIKKQKSRNITITINKEVLDTYALNHYLWSVLVEAVGERLYKYKLKSEQEIKNNAEDEIKKMRLGNIREIVNNR